MNNKHCTGRLLEPEIKAMVLNYLKNIGKITKNTSIINEFTVENFSRRVDLATVNNSHLIAFEIKSAADSLYRLDGQTKKYLEYFDKVVVVAASKHVDKVIEIVPKHVAVWEICGERIRIKQRGRIIPIKNKENLIKLMKANELLKLRNRLGFSSTSKNRKNLETSLLKASVSDLRESSLHFIKDRYHLTSCLFWKRVGVNEAVAADIEILSPYRKGRHAVKGMNNNAKAYWEYSGKVLNEDPYLIAMSQGEKMPLFGPIPSEIQILVAA